jgi:hypothetical protein
VTNSDRPEDSVTGFPPAALDVGDKIEAIKLVREATGLGLKEAKEEVKRYLDAAPLVGSRYRAAIAESRRSALLWLLAIALLIGVSAYFLLTR